MTAKEGKDRIKRLKISNAQYVFDSNGKVTDVLVSFKQLKQLLCEPMAGHIIDNLIEQACEVERDYQERQAEEDEKD